MKKKYPRKRRESKFEQYYQCSTEISSQTLIGVDREIFVLIKDILLSAKNKICMSFFQANLSAKKQFGIPFQLLNILRSARERKVEIKVVLNKKFGNAGQYYLNYQTIKELRKVGIEAKFIEDGKILHNKLIIVDEICAYVGSSNLTVTSMCDNHEIGIKIQGKFVKEKIQKYFDKIWTS